MSFQAYIDTIHAKTGKTPVEIYDAARAAGVHRDDMKAGELVAWLKSEYGLGHGHSMALWNVFVTEGWVHPANTKLKGRGK